MIEIKDNLTCEDYNAAATAIRDLRAAILSLDPSGSDPIACQHFFLALDALKTAQRHATIAHYAQLRAQVDFEYGVRI